MNLLKILPLILVVFLAGCAAQEEVTTTPTVTPQYSLELTSYPMSVKAGDEFTISWKVDSNVQTKIVHTAIHYDNVSFPGDYGLDLTADASGYKSLTTEFASGSFSIPNDFTTKIKAGDAGTLYFRAHAIIDGKNYWTREYMVIVETPAPAGIITGTVVLPSRQVIQYSLEVDDNGYYSNSETVTSLSAKKGETVNLTLNVRTTNVYTYGLDFRGCSQSTPPVSVGGSISIQMTANETCTITAYWPGTQNAKGSLQFLVS